MWPKGDYDSRVEYTYVHNARIKQNRKQVHTVSQNGKKKSTFYFSNNSVKN